MSERMRGISPEQARLQGKISDRVKGLDPLAEKHRGPESFKISDAEVNGEAPAELRPEYAKLTRAVFLSLAAHAGAWYGLSGVEGGSAAPRVEKSPQKIAAEERVEGMLTEWKVEAKHNKEIVEQLEAEREHTIDRLTDVYLDPNSPDYHSETTVEIGGRPMPSIDVFIDLDAQNSGITYAKNAHGKIPSVKEVHKRTERVRADELAEYNERLELLLQNEHYVWTGELEEDLLTLRTAMFEGPDRFFSSPYYSEAKYQKDSWRVSEQLASGLVQCTVSRMTPILLERIYESHGFDEAPLLNLRAAVWQSHVQTAIEYEDGSARSFTELSKDKPLEDGVDSPMTGQTATLLPIEHHLAYYLAHNGSTLEQQDRLRELGYLPRVAAKYKLTEPSGHVIDLAQFVDRPQSAQSETAEVGRRAESLEHGEMTEASARWRVRDAMLATVNDYVKNRARAEAFRTEEAGGAYYVEIPRWVSDDRFREYVTVHHREFEISFTMKEQAYVFQALKLWSLGKTDRERGIVEEMASKIAEKQYLHGTISPPIEEAETYSNYGMGEAADAIIKDERFVPQIKELFRYYGDGVVECDLNVSQDGFCDSAVVLFDRSERLLRLSESHDIPVELLEEARRGKELAIKYRGDQHTLSFVTEDDLRGMSKEELRRRLVDNSAYNGDETGNTFAADGRAEILFNKFADDVDALVLLNGLGFIQASLDEPYLRALEGALGAGHEPGSWYRVEDIKPKEISYEDYARFAVQYPQIFNKYYREDCEQMSDFVQDLIGIYEIIHQKPPEQIVVSSSDFTLDDRQAIFELEDPQSIKRLQNIYVNSTDQVSRLDFLSNITPSGWYMVEYGTIHIPKDMLYPEDLALMRDLSAYDNLALAYNLDALTAGDLVEHVRSNHYVGFLSVFERDFAAGVRLLEKIEAMPETP